LVLSLAFAAATAAMFAALVLFLDLTAAVDHDADFLAVLARFGEGPFGRAVRSDVKNGGRLIDTTSNYGDAECVLGEVTQLPACSTSSSSPPSSGRPSSSDPAEFQLELNPRRAGIQTSASDWLLLVLGSGGIP